MSPKRGIGIEECLERKMGDELASLSFFLVTLGTTPPLPLTNNLVGDAETPLKIVSS